MLYHYRKIKCFVIKYKHLWSKTYCIMEIDMKKDYIICLSATVCFFLIFIFTMKSDGSPTSTNESISQMEEQISENESRYDEIQNKLDELNANKENLAEYIVSLNESYDAIINSIQAIDLQINEKMAEIEVIDKEIQDKMALIDEQYQDMALRIQYMYENNSLDMYSAIFGAVKFSEFMNQIDYINEVVNYDRNMLEELEIQVDYCNVLKEQNKTSIAQLQELKAQQSEQKLQIENMMAQASINIGNHQAQIDEAEAVARQMVAEIEAQRNSVERLREEESRRVQESIRKESMLAEGITEETIEYQALDGDIKRLAAIIYCEARGESYEGQVAVGTVVMNRVESSRFPNTIEEVIAAPNQFTPYGMGLYAIALAKVDMQQSCIDAARAVLEEGVRLGDWLFFRTVNGIVQGTVIGNHVFY